MSKVALVTGGSGGIGSGICVALAKAGFDVAIHYNRNADRANDVKAKVEACGQRAVILQADLTDSESCNAMVDACREQLGGLYALVNNAGITDDGLLMRMTDDQYRNVLQANMDSCFFCTRAALRGLVKQKGGRIVNITSVVGIMGNAGQTNYAASKAAMIGFTKSCAKEVARKGVCVNAVAPGFIETAMTDELSDDVKAAMKNAIPMRRFGSAEDVAGVVEFLCGDSASYITGQVLVVDGGMVT